MFQIIIARNRPKGRQLKKSRSSVRITAMKLILVSLETSLPGGAVKSTTSAVATLKMPYVVTSKLL